MVSATEVETFFRGGYRDYVPHLSVDCVIFGFHERELKILLLKWNELEAWSLPGGYVHQSEPLDQAAHSVLRDRTGLEEIYLQQFHAFGGTDRGEAVLRKLYQSLGLPIPDDAWFLERIVSIGYYALVDWTEVTPTPDFFTAACAWWDVREHPPLSFDHDEIVESALRELRLALSYRPIGLNLLPEKFTMPELRALYETILGRPLDRRNFQKRMLDLGIVERLDERKTGVAHRAPNLYRFDAARYARALREGM